MPLVLTWSNLPRLWVEPADWFEVELVAGPILALVVEKKSIHSIYPYGEIEWIELSEWIDTQGEIYVKPEIDCFGWTIERQNLRTV